MKSLPLLVFAAFAAFVPSTRASDYLATLPVDAHRHIIRELPSSDQALYGAVNRETRKTVKTFGEDSFVYRVKLIFKGLGMQIPDATIASVFNRKTGASAYNPPVSMTDIINVIGPDQLRGNAKLIKRVANLAGTPPEGANPNIVVDPRGLLLLLREDENDFEKRKYKAKESQKQWVKMSFFSDNEWYRYMLGHEDAESKSEDKDKYSIDDIFKQNAEKFKYGLEINESWIDNGLLEWVFKGRGSEQYPVKFTYSHGDLVARMCFYMYSHPTLLGSKAQLTWAEIREITDGMVFFLKYLGVQPTLETLSKLKAGPLKTDPVAFDFKDGLKSCIARHPSIYTLTESLISLADTKTKPLNIHIDRNGIFTGFLSKAGMNAEDLYWMTRTERESDYYIFGLNSLPFKHAITVMCGDARVGHDHYDCSKSIYFLNTPGNGVLGWDTLSWVLRKMLEQKFYSGISEVLSWFAKHSLLPAHASAESKIFKSAMKLLESTKYDMELNASGKKIFENLLSGKGPKEPKAALISRIIGMLPGKKKP